jgi:hypothetical protein
MPSVKITDVQVWNVMGEDTTLFKQKDAMSFALGVDLSPDLTADLDNEYQATFQIVNAATNQPFINWTQVYKIPENWHAWWFTVGNNWDSTNYTTPDNLGLNPPQPAVYGFRGILQVKHYELGDIYIDALDVSTFRWFEIQTWISYVGDTGPR